MPSSLRPSLLDRLSRIPPVITFLPVLVFGIIVVFLFSKDTLIGDEGRYYDFAHNLTKGFYSPPAPDINLVSGWGYPIFLAPFAALGAPLIAWRFLNAVMFYVAAIFFYKAVRVLFNPKQSFVISWVVWLPMMYLNRHLQFLYSENITMLFICAVIYTVVRAFAKKDMRIKDLILPAATIAYLIWVKVIFAYVMLILIIVGAVFWAFVRKKEVGYAALLPLMALVFAMPYAIYTFNLTGKFFYWSNWTGDNRYWMTTTVEGEWGGWKNHENVTHPVHREFFDSISHLKGVEYDEAVRAKASENIRNHPKKFFMNWTANVQRLFFNFPFGRRKQKPMFLWIPSLFIVPLSVLMIIPTLRVLRFMPLGIVALLAMEAVYLAGSTMASVNIRMYHPTIPILGIWLAYMFVHFIRFEIPKPEVTAAPDARPHSLNGQAHENEPILEEQQW
ncbi:MAG: hypothetical protein AAFV07_09315 [Bacteroidota bacterium]